MRGHGEGTILTRKRRRKDGTVATRYVVVASNVDGSKVSRWFTSRKDAEDERKRLSDLRAVGRLDAAKLTLGAYLRRWASSLDLAPATMKQHRMIITHHLVPKLGDVLLGRLQPADVDRYLTRTDLHPQTLRHHRATLRRALADAHRDGLVTRNAAALSRAPRLRTVERTYLDAAQASALMAAAKGTRLYAPVTVALCTGLRQAEMLALTWADIDWKARTAQVRHTLHRIPNAPEGVYPWERLAPKTDKSRRTVDLVPLAIEALRQRQREQAADRGGLVPLDALVFTTPSGHPIHGPNLLPPLRAALKAAGLPEEVTWHDMRHATASILLGAGVPLPVISRMLGHSTIRVTADLYAHVVPELQKDAADRLQGALTKASGVQTGVRRKSKAR